MSSNGPSRAVPFLGSTPGRWLLRLQRDGLQLSSSTPRAHFDHSLSDPAARFTFCPLVEVRPNTKFHQSPTRPPKARDVEALAVRVILAHEREFASLEHSAHRTQTAVAMLEAAVDGGGFGTSRELLQPTTPEARLVSCGNGCGRADWQTSPFTVLPTDERGRLCLIFFLVEPASGVVHACCASRPLERLEGAQPVARSIGHADAAEEPYVDPIHRPMTLASMISVAAASKAAPEATKEQREAPSGAKPHPAEQPLLDASIDALLNAADLADDDLDMLDQLLADEVDEPANDDSHSGSIVLPPPAMPAAVDPLQDEAEPAEPKTPRRRSVSWASGVEMARQREGRTSRRRSKKAHEEGDTVDQVAPELPPDEERGELATSVLAGKVRPRRMRSVVRDAASDPSDASMAAPCATKPAWQGSPRLEDGDAAASAGSDEHECRRALQWEEGKAKDGVEPPPPHARLRKHSLRPLECVESVKTPSSLSSEGVGTRASREADGTLEVRAAAANGLACASTTQRSTPPQVASVDEVELPRSSADAALVSRPTRSSMRVAGAAVRDVLPALSVAPLHPSLLVEVDPTSSVHVLTHSHSNSVCDATSDDGSGNTGRCGDQHSPASSPPTTSKPALSPSLLPSLEVSEAVPSKGLASAHDGDAAVLVAQLVVQRMQQELISARQEIRELKERQAPVHSLDITQLNGPAGRRAELGASLPLPDAEADARVASGRYPSALSMSLPIAPVASIDEHEIMRKNRLLYNQNQVLLALLQKPNDGIAPRAAIRVQSAHRRQVARTSFTRRRAAAAALQARVRGRAGRAAAARRLAAVVRLQRHARRWLCRVRRVRRLEAAVVLQRSARGLVARRRLQRARGAAIAVQAAQRGVVHRRRLVVWKRAALVVQRRVRLYLDMVVRFGPSKTALRREAMLLRLAVGGSSEVRSTRDTSWRRRRDAETELRAERFRLDRAKKEIARLHAAAAAEAARTDDRVRTRVKAAVRQQLEAEQRALEEARAAVEAERAQLEATRAQMQAQAAPSIASARAHEEKLRAAEQLAEGQQAVLDRLEQELHSERSHRRRLEDQLELQSQALSFAQVLAQQAGTHARVAEEKSLEASQAREELKGLRNQLDESSRCLARDGVVKKRFADALTHMAGADAVFHLPNFLKESAPVVESHVFSAAGHQWKMWVKPYSGTDSDAVGLYLAPAADLDQMYTADYQLAIVGSCGTVLSLELQDGRARLQKATAGHGFPNFLPRAELEASETLLHDGSLVVTASKISNIRPRLHA